MGIKAAFEQGLVREYHFLIYWFASEHGISNLSILRRESLIFFCVIFFYLRHTVLGVDPSCAARANKKISSYASFMPSKQDCFMNGITQEGQSYKVECWINQSTTVRFAN